MLVPIMVLPPFVVMKFLKQGIEGNREGFVALHHAARSGKKTQLSP